MTACEPREPLSEAEKRLKTTREIQAETKIRYDNPEPVTGFEHTVTFDLMGRKLVIPYGYLVKASKNHATEWLSDTPSRDGYYEEAFHISFYPKKTAQGWVLEPYNAQNKQHFAKYMKDGLSSVDSVMIEGHACTLASDTLGDDIVKLYGGKKITSDYPDYDIYEESAIPENPKFYKLTYIKKTGNPVIISQERGYGASVGACINGLSITYYPFGISREMQTQQDLIGYHQQVEQLISSFLTKETR